MIWLATGRGLRGPTSWCHREPTIAEMLSDSIVIAIMQADGVDPIALEAQLRGLARGSTAAGRAGQRPETG